MTPLKAKKLKNKQDLDMGAARYRRTPTVPFIAVDTRSLFLV